MCGDGLTFFSLLSSLKSICVIEKKTAAAKQQPVSLSAQQQHRTEKEKEKVVIIYCYFIISINTRTSTKQTLL